MSKMSIAAKVGIVKRYQNNRPSAGVRLPFHVNPARSTAGSAFTIVELLIVIVIIGILAAITIVSYSGITQKANTAALQSDLTNAKKQFELYYTEHNVYPTALDSNNCPTNPSVTPTDTNYCLKSSGGATYTLASGNNATTYSLKLSKNNQIYSVTNQSTPSISIPTNDANWITIGSQTWAKTNLNVGTMVTGATEQTNNGTIEKYCYNNDEANCTTYGALYQWNEAMQYVTTEKAQGICPTGSHIPSDAEWKILEMQLGMTQAQADAISWRGTDQATKLRDGGISGLNIPFSGIRQLNGSFAVLGTDIHLLSSSATDPPYAIGRYLLSAYSTINRAATAKGFGFSIRCLAN